MVDDDDEPIFRALLELVGITSSGAVDGVVGTLLRAGREVLHADGVAVLLESSGVLRVAGGVPHAAEQLAEADLRDGGPGSTAHAHGVEETFTLGLDAHGGPQDWPRFAAAARARGVRTVHAAPVCMGERRLGAVLFCWSSVLMLEERDVRVAEALGQMAAVGIINRREVEEHDRRASQLQQALDSRVVIEQAKGMIAERAHVDPATAFELIRSTSRASGRPLSDVARDVVRGLRTCYPVDAGAQDSPPLRSRRRPPSPRLGAPRS